MGKLRCSQCKELAHVLIEKKAYCLECAPKPVLLVEEEPAIAEVIKEKPRTKIVLDKIGSVEVERIEKRKKWWRMNSE